MRESKEFLGRLLGEHSRIHIRPRPVVVAVMGTDRGVGTTHFCMAAVNFLANVRGLRTVLAELNMHPVRQRLENSGDDTMTDFIKSFDEIQAGGCGYDVVILDISGDYPKGAGEFVRSDFRFITGSLAAWKYESFMQTLEGMADLHDRFDTVCLSLAYDRQAAKKIKRKYGIDVVEVPYIANPLRLKPEHCKWFDGQLAGIWRQ
ncbi:MAG: hypothetical protein PUE71_06245 [Clostridia bacterium]|nr:hypothetical protein [Clostridia bacterium]